MTLLSTQSVRRRRNDQQGLNKKHIEQTVEVKGSSFCLSVSHDFEGYASIEELETMRYLVIKKDEIRNVIDMLTEAEKFLFGNSAQ